MDAAVTRQGIIRYLVMLKTCFCEGVDGQRGHVQYALVIRQSKNVRINQPLEPRSLLQGKFIGGDMLREKALCHLQ